MEGEGKETSADAGKLVVLLRLDECLWTYEGKALDLSPSIFRERLPSTPIY